MREYEGEEDEKRMKKDEKRVGSRRSMWRCAEVHE